MTHRSSTLPPPEGGPLTGLPRRTARQIALESRLVRGDAPRLLGAALGWLDDLLAGSLMFEHPDILMHAEGLKRPGVIAQFALPRRDSRFACALDPPLVHAVVDRLLGFSRFEGEERLQVTPVEWGVLGYVAARTLEEFEAAGAFETWGPALVDRVGPEPFAVEDVGSIITIRRYVSVGSRGGFARLWMPESLAYELAETAEPAAESPAFAPNRYGLLTAAWTCTAGSLVTSHLSVGDVRLLRDSGLEGSMPEPYGRLELTVRGPSRRWVVPVEPVAGTNLRRMAVAGPLRMEPGTQESQPMSMPSPGPSDAPVTLSVELGRIAIPIHELADLKPGDTLNLHRHAREPVELTSAGRTVARGELVQIDDGLGVRILSVFI